MFFITVALLLFAGAVGVHIIYCRNTVKSGLHAKVFVMVAIGALIFYLLVPARTSLDPDSLWGMPLKITAGAIFLLLVPVYLCFYVLTQLTSPSKKILAAIAEARQLSYGDILSIVEKEDFTGSRLIDLLKSGCVDHFNGRYALTWEGRRIAGLLEILQVILGRKVGG